MTVKRDKVTIIKDMLKIISTKGGKAKPTQVMYKANLSYLMLTEYLNELKTKEFITEQTDKKGKKTYSITDKGYSFLNDYRQIKNFFDSYGLS